MSCLLECVEPYSLYCYVFLYAHTYIVINLNTYILFRVATTVTLSTTTTSVSAINNTALISQLASTSVTIMLSNIPVETTAVSASLTPSVNVTAGEDSSNTLLVEAIIPAIAAVIIIILVVFVVVLCYRSRRTSWKNRQYNSEFK